MSRTVENLERENAELRKRLVKLESAKVALKLAEAALKESEERMRAQYHAIPVPTYTWAKRGSDFSLVAMNRAAEVDTGETAGDFIGRTAREIFPDRADIVEDIERCYQTRTIVRRETPYVTRSTGISQWLIFTYAFTPPNAVLMHSENISERKQAEMALRESEERFRQLAEATDQVFWFTALDRWRILYVSPAFERIWGFPAEDLYANPGLWMEPIHPEDRLVVKRAYAACAKGRRRDFQVDFRLRHPDGSIRWILDHGAGIRNGEGEIYRISGIARDITQRRKAIEALRESELRFRTVAEFTYDWEYWRGPDGRFIYVSPSCERITGYPPSAFMANPDLLEEIIVPEDRPRFEKHRATRKVVGKVYRLDFSLRRRSGEACRVAQISQVVHDPERGFLGIRASNREIEAP